MESVRRGYFVVLVAAAVGLVVSIALPAYLHHRSAAAEASDFQHVREAAMNAEVPQDYAEQSACSVAQAVRCFRVPRRSSAVANDLRGILATTDLKSTVRDVDHCLPLRRQGVRTHFACALTATRGKSTLMIESTPMNEISTEVTLSVMRNP